LHTWLSKYLLPPIRSTRIATPKKVAPNGFPTCLKRNESVGFVGFNPSLSEIVVFSLKSCVMAMPMEAKASEVRSQARNVRSVLEEGILLAGGCCYWE